MKVIFRKAIGLLILSISCVTIKAQPNGSVRALEIGQQCPDFKFDNLARYPRPTARLSDFKNKLVILDFWATWCGSCLYALPFLDKIQRKHPHEVVILPVTFEKKEAVLRFLENNNFLKNSVLPSVTQDSLLSSYFPHNLLPHDVWINGDGRVIAITGSEEVNEENIEKVLSGEKISLHQKRDIFGQDIDKPMLLGGLGPDYRLEENNLKYSSLLTGNIEGIPSSNSTQATKRGNRVSLLAENSSLDCIFNMVLTAKYNTSNSLIYESFYAGMRSRMILEVKDSSYYTHRVPGSNNMYVPPPEKMFCYEIIRPLSDSQKICSDALAELNNYFGNTLGIEALKEKRKVRCWVLTRLNNGNIPYSHGGRTNIIIDTSNNTILLHNLSIDEFIIALMYRELFNSPIPMINETGITDPVDFDIKADPMDPLSIGKSLEKYGLKIVLEERELEMNIIRDKLTPVKGN